MPKAWRSVKNLIGYYKILCFASLRHDCAAEAASLRMTHAPSIRCYTILRENGRTKGRPYIVYTISIWKAFRTPYGPSLTAAWPSAVQHTGQRVSPATRALTSMPWVALVMPEQVA